MSVWPSGAADDSTSSAIWLPAPGRLSTTTLWPTLSASFCASPRVVVSMFPPLVSGTRMRMGRVGKAAFWACAGARKIRPHSPARHTASSRPVMYALAPRFPSIDINATLQRARMRVQPAVALRRSARRPGGDAGGKRLHRDLSVPHDERIGDHLVDVVR